MNTTSPKWSLNSIDWKKIGRNAFVFLAPVAIIYLLFVIAGLQQGFVWSAFVPNNATVGAMVLYVLNVLLDFFRKLIANNSPATS